VIVGTASLQGHADRCFNVTIRNRCPFFKLSVDEAGRWNEINANNEGEFFGFLRKTFRESDIFDGQSIGSVSSVGAQCSD